MGILSTLNVGSTGLQVAADAIGVVGHNVTNAANKGYSRQTISTATVSPLLQDGLWVGQGVSATDIGRATNLFIAERAIAAQGDASSADTALRANQLIEASFTSGGSSDQLSAFFDAMEQLATDPSNENYRYSMLSTAESLTDAVRTTHTEMTDIQSVLNDEIESTVAGVNDALSRIAQLNGLIAQGGSGDLMDERDGLIAELGSTLGATVDYSSDGSATVFLGGHAAVMDGSAREVSVEIDSDGVAEIKLSVDDATVTVTDSVGGAVGGAIEGWNVAQGVIDSLNEFVTGFATAFNTQSAAGFDSSGTPGTDVFSFDATDPAASFSVAMTDPGQIAAAASVDATAGDRGNLDALIALKDSGAVNGEGALDFMTGLTSEIGRSVAAAQQRFETDTAALEDASAMLSSISGVNLDEEAADLLSWQAAYQAAARVISATDEMLGELMNIVR